MVFGLGTGDVPPSSVSDSPLPALKSAKLILVLQIPLVLPHFTTVENVKLHVEWLVSDVARNTLAPKPLHSEKFK
jgi:hypothetical protein